MRRRLVVALAMTLFGMACAGSAPGVQDVTEEDLARLSDSDLDELVVYLWSETSEEGRWESMPNEDFTVSDIRALMTGLCSDLDAGMSFDDAIPNLIQAVAAGAPSASQQEAFSMAGIVASLATADCEQYDDEYVEWLAVQVPSQAVTEEDSQSLSIDETNEIVEQGRAAIDQATLVHLQEQCHSGDLVGCDVLSLVADPASGYYLVAKTCGGRNDYLGAGEGYCITYHDAVDLSSLKEGCGNGDFGACDLLWAHVPFGHEDEAFAEQCGGVGESDIIGLCVMTYGVGSR